MKLLVVLVAVCLQQVLSQGCVDLNVRCPDSMYFCHEPSQKAIMQLVCPKSCPKLCTKPQMSPNYPANCGRPSVQASRVINGVNAKAGSWPWQVLMLLFGSPMCGGSIIAPNWVVTAAHCVDGYEQYVNNFKVRAGEHNTNTVEGNEQDIQVKKIFKYGGYYKGNLRNDIALLQLSSAIQFGTHVQPVCLPSQGDRVPVGSSCYITGWGKIAHPGKMHHTLQQAKITVVSNAVCHALNYKNLNLAVVKDTMVCAGLGPSSRTMGCHGDSGGPFVCRDSTSGAFELQGAVSWGSGTCDSTKAYTVFARVSEFRKWIDQTILAN